MKLSITLFAIFIALASPILIKVKTLTGKEMELDIDPDDKIRRIKEKVKEQSGVPPLPAADGKSRYCLKNRQHLEHTLLIRGI